MANSDDWPNWKEGTEFKAVRDAILREAGDGHIVNTASVTAIGAGGVYGASKAAVLAFSESLRDELAEIRGLL